MKTGRGKKPFYKLRFGSKDWQNHMGVMTSPCLGSAGEGRGFRKGRAGVSSACVGGGDEGTQGKPPHLAHSVCDSFRKAEAELSSKACNPQLLRAILPEGSLVLP